ncbi:hypothetical protein GCM10023184_13400 [Flaviaesturariibacter amylovorans]|uniref:Uncharacterized protein n=1 Tax=Flaviaesturariibacter amylovorans TaxID=1084520 RepID=A0ABP8GJB1_9BACT
MLYKGPDGYAPDSLYICTLKMNTSTHNKHFIFHTPGATRMYDVCFDLFRYLSRRGI